MSRDRSDPTRGANYIAQAAAVTALLAATALLALLDVQSWKNLAVLATAILVIFGFASLPTEPRQGAQQQDD